MFVQSTFGTADRPEQLRGLLAQWEHRARLEAVGYLGSTSGITAKQKVVVLRAFESREAAHATAAHDELAALTAQAERLVLDVDANDSTAVVSMLGGSAPLATFVQVMRGHALEAARMPDHTSTMAQIEQRSRAWRPDILGEVIAVYADGTYSQAAYFTSEADARRNEQTLPPQELRADLGALMSAIQIDEYLDLTEPNIT